MARPGVLRHAALAAATTAAAFGGRLHDEVDADGVSADLLAVLAQTVQPRSAGLWLRAGAL